MQQNSQASSTSQNNLEQEVTSLQQQVRERDERIAKMTTELQSSHEGVQETAQQLASLQKQLQRMASYDARLHSMQEEVDSKNKSIQVSTLLPQSHLCFLFQID